MTTPPQKPEKSPDDPEHLSIINPDPAKEKKRLERLKELLEEIKRRGSRGEGGGHRGPSGGEKIG